MKPKRHNRVAGSVGPGKRVRMLCTRCIEPPVETVNPGPRRRKMIRLAAVSGDAHIFVRWGVAAERQILGDLWPHIVVEIGTREQLPFVPIPTIQPEPRN